MLCWPYGAGVAVAGVEVVACWGAAVGVGGGGSGGRTGGGRTQGRLLASVIVTVWPAHGVALPASGCTAVSWPAMLTSWPGAEEVTVSWLSEIDGAIRKLNVPLAGVRPEAVWSGGVSVSAASIVAVY